MNTKRDTTSATDSMATRFRRRIGPAMLTLLAALALALTVPARAETQPPAIPFPEIGARATANYQGDAMGITATTDGARLRCGFQKLEGQATPEGLWLESTKPGGGQLRLVAVAVGRGGSRACPHTLTEAASSVRSGMSIVTVPQNDQAPLGATCTYGATSSLDMPLLTELEATFSGVPFYRHAAPDGASACLRQGGQTLSRTGEVSVRDKLVRFTRPGLTEEYSVSVDGVRQDFIIESPPLNPPPSAVMLRRTGQPSTLNHSAGDLRVELALSGARAEATTGGVRLRLEGSGRTLAYSRLRVEDATGRELTARLEVPTAKAESRKQKAEMGQDLATSASTTSSNPAPALVVVVEDATATYPVRIDPTFSDSDWVTLNPGLPGANDFVGAIAADGSGNVYVGGDFTVIGTVRANFIAKWDGSAWSALGSGMDGYVSAVAVSGTNLYAGGWFTNAGGVKANGIAKWNGSAWSALGSGVGGYYVYNLFPPFQRIYHSGSVSALAMIGSNLYAGGRFDSAVGNIAKWDGSAWSTLEGGSVGPLAVSGTNLYAGGQFLTAGGVSVKGVAKWNGSAWSVLGSGMDDSVGALAVSGTNLYAGGYITTAGGVPANCIAKWNGSAWSALGSGIGGYDINLSVSALAVLGTNLYAGGNFTTAGGVMVNYIAKWDGSAWSALGSGMGGEVWALAVSGTNLYAGGTFSTVGGLLADYIAKWDGNVWSALGSGIFAFNVSVDVYALAVSGTDLYVGGEFTGPAGYITKWDGSAWSALGSGLDGWVRALAVSGTNLYAGGDFTTAGGVTANGIAKWDGSAWSALGSGMGGDNYFPDVLALAASGSNLYAGGNFTTAGGVPVHNIAKWNGSAWSALGSGMGGGDYYFPSVYALAVSGTDLYVGGWFTNVGGLPANCIAKWNGSAWSTLGSGMDADVRALAVSGTNLYAGGYFTNAGGVPANYVAKWNGSAWSALGQGMAGSWYNTPVVHSLALSGSDLYAGGWFTNAGGAPANYIAKWDGNAWSPLGSGISGNPVASYNQVESLAADGVGHLFVGGNFLLAGTNVSPYIAQANVGSTESLEAHFTYTITNDKITITGYTGPGGAVTIPSALNGLPVTSIGDRAFYLCTNLTSLTIPDCVTSIADYAFSYCTSLTALQFGGNAPSLGSPYVFTGDTNATIYYLPGTEGWGSTFGGRPTALWFLPNPLILTSGPGFGVQSNAFGFIISWSTNLPVVVEACTNLANHSWSPVHTNALTGGWSYFSDPQWANYPGRFYRVRSP